MSTSLSDFTRYADEVQNVFKAYSSSDERTAHDNAIQAKSEIDQIFLSIVEQVTQGKSFEAKAQALNATTEIADWIINEGDRSFIGENIRGSLPHTPLSSTIRQILDMLLPEELAALQADGEIPKAMHQLRLRAEAYALDLRINDSIDRLWLEESDQEDEAAHMALWMIDGGRSATRSTTSELQLTTIRHPRSH
ncbi:hypothetical protein MBLNU13_g04409t1 [Cladosporium sp. NU13]